MSDEGPKGTAAIGSYFKVVATQERSFCVPLYLIR